MKPDCQQVLTQFASFSVEELSDSEAASLLQHLEECEPCKGQWLLFEKTLFVTTQSGPREEDVEQTRSQQMWLVCLEHARKKSGVTAEAPALIETATSKHSMQHEESAETGPQSGSVLAVPRTGITLVGGALFLLASAYLFAPHSQASASAVPPPMAAHLQTTGFAPRASGAVTLVDYGATLGFDALANRAVPTLIVTPAARNLACARMEIS